jgi:microcystin-dependent protein
MSRVNFVDTIVLPLGPGGSMIPVPGIAVVPFTVNPDESEGPQAVAYAARTGATQAATLVTDFGGRVNYWLESGDYDMQYSDTQNPPRIENYMLGFSAADAGTGELITTGDTKFSFQPTDHGQNPDGTYEWLLVTSDADGGGRKLQQSQYMALWYELGNPVVDGNGNFRLPNISGRQLVAAGTASGLAARTLYERYGGETVTLGPTNVPPHYHYSSGTTSGQSNDHSHGYSGNTGAGQAQITSTDPLNGYWHFYTAAPMNLQLAENGSGTSTVVGIGSAGGSGQMAGINHAHNDTGHTHYFSGQSGGTNADHSHNFGSTTDGGTSSPVGGGLGASGNGSGGAASFSNLDPSYVMNLFIKS